MSYSPYTYVDSPLFDPNFDMNRCSTTTPLYVEDIDPTIDDLTLYNFFCQYGPVYSIERTQDQDHLSYSKLAAFIHFYFRKDAESALKGAQYHKIGRYNLIIRLAHEDKDLLEKARINVGNLELTVTAKELHSHFEKAGANVLFAKVSTDKEGKSSGHGYVICNRKEDANYAMCRLLAGTKLKDQELKLSINASHFKVSPEIDEKMLYVKYLPVNQDQKSLSSLLEGLFGKYGEVRAIALQKHPKKEMHSGIVEFKMRESAIVAYIDLSENLKDYGAPEGPLYVDWYEKNFEKAHNGEIQSRSAETTLFVKTLRLTVKPEDLKRVFKRFGIVSSVSCQDHVCNNSRKTVRCGYICFSSEAEAHKALYEALDFSEVRELFDRHGKPYINLYHPKKEIQELDNIKRELMVELRYMDLINKMYESNPFAFFAMQPNLPLGVFSPVFNINQMSPPPKADLKSNKTKEFSPAFSPSPRSKGVKEADPVGIAYQMRDFYRMKQSNQRKLITRLLLPTVRDQGGSSSFNFEAPLDKKRVRELLLCFVEKVLLDGKYSNLIERVTDRLTEMIGMKYSFILEFVMDQRAQKKKLEEIAEQIEDEKLLKEAGDNLLKDDVSDTYSINDEDLSTHFKENRNPNVLLNSLRANDKCTISKEKDIELITQACLGMKLERFLKLDVDMQRTRLGKALFENVREIAGDALALRITPMLADLSKYKVKEVIEAIGFRDLLMQRINESMNEIGNGRK